MNFHCNDEVLPRPSSLYNSNNCALKVMLWEISAAYWPLLDWYSQLWLAIIPRAAAQRYLNSNRGFYSIGHSSYIYTANSNLAESSLPHMCMPIVKSFSNFAHNTANVLTAKLASWTNVILRYVDLRRFSKGILYIAHNKSFPASFGCNTKCSRWYGLITCISYWSDSIISLKYQDTRFL